MRATPNQSIMIFSNPTEPSRISVLVADADAMTARLLVNELRRQRDFHIVECAPEAIAIVQCISDSAPQVLLVSENIREGSLVRLGLLRQLHHEHPRTRGVVLMEASRFEIVPELFRAGAKGVFDRSGFDVKLLCRCIRCVAAGQVWASSEQMDCVLDTFCDTASLRIVSAEGETLLTRREHDVVRLVAEGLVNREVAQHLGLSEHTVKNYLFNVFNKLGISSRAELILYAVANSDNRVARAHVTVPRRIKANGNAHLKANCRSHLRR
jgi:DNA-binding NarL/FixJ family response regulator